MPILFVGHGSPWMQSEENEFVKGWRQMAICSKPTAVLCISAHWETKGTFVTGNGKASHHSWFRWFPTGLVWSSVSCSGSPAIAEKTKRLYIQHLVELDQRMGLDHGCWSVVKHLYPKADVPVLQMSLDLQQTGTNSLWSGQENSFSSGKMGCYCDSGNIVHNLRSIDWKNPDSGLWWWQSEVANKIPKITAPAPCSNPRHNRIFWHKKKSIRVVCSFSIGDLNRRPLINSISSFFFCHESYWVRNWELARA